MITMQGLEDLARAIAQANNLDLKLARRYANLIGDVIELADDGKLIVRDEQGNEIARVILPPESAASTPA